MEPQEKVSMHNFTNGATTVKASDSQREKILNGDPTASLQAFDIPAMVTAGFSSAQVLDIVDDDHPAPGNATLVYMQDDSWTGVSIDHLKIWNINIDWSNSSNSSSFFSVILILSIKI